MEQKRTNLDFSRETASRVVVEPTLAADEIDLQALLLTLWRRKFLLAFVIISITAMAVVSVLSLTPIFQASALVMIDDRRANVVVEIEDVVPTLGTDGATVETQVAILTSRALAHKVIDRLELVNDAEFNPALWGESLSLNPLSYIPKSWVMALRGQTEEQRQEQSVARAQSREPVVDVFLSKLDVLVVPETYTISITFASPDPNKAADVVNTLADIYIADQLKEKHEATQRANKWLNERLEDLRKEVLEAEAAVGAYRGEAGLSQGNGATVTDQQLSEVNSQLVGARAERVATEARLRQLRKLLKTPGAIDSSPEILDAPTIRELRTQEIQLQRTQAELSNIYGDRHPQMISLKAELQDVRGKIGREVQKIVGALENQVSVARARESAIRASLTELQGSAAESDKAEVRLTELQREAEVSRNLYEVFLLRVKEMTEQDSLQTPDSRILSRASVPTRPSFPQPLITVAAAFAGSVLIGILLVIVVEKFAGGFRSTEEIARATGAPVLGLVPSMGRFARFRRPSQKHMTKVEPAFKESIRNLRTGLMLSNRERPPKVVLITSSLPREGKSTLAGAVAWQTAKSGKKCMIIDCDLRRPKLHTTMGVAIRPGLVELLEGEKTLEEVVHVDEESGLEFITAGAETGAPSDLLASQEMKDLLMRLTRRYDQVIMDAPPVLVVGDARILCRLADKTLYLVRWARTRQESVVSGIRQILEADGTMPLTVLARVNARKYAKFGFADSGIYTSVYSQYYHERAR